LCSIKYIDLQINHFWGNRTAAIATVIMTTITRQYNRAIAQIFRVLYCTAITWVTCVGSLRGMGGTISKKLGYN